MTIKSLHITNFRNIRSAKIECTQHFNLFYGDNAAGKTSLLEAIYYLSTGKSFQTHLHELVIRNAENHFVLFARLNSGMGETEIGLQRCQDGSRSIRINETAIASIAELSSQLPVQFIDTNSDRILTDGPRVRREFLDWGLFHTNPAFFPIWKQFQKLLAQRNAALKARASIKEMRAWNIEFSQVSEALHTLRKLYLLDFIEYFYKIVSHFLKLETIIANYFPGWDDQFSLYNCLEKNLSREYQITYTISGPHRADLCLFVNNIPAKNYLSQGQQKLLSYALRLAQGLHLQATTQKTPIYLIDDLSSELDLDNQNRVIKILADLQAQLFVTCISADNFQKFSSLDRSMNMFHVKHGEIALKNNTPLAIQDANSLKAERII